MERGELPEELTEEIRRRTFAESGFMKIVQTVRRGGTLFRISMRPVEIGGERKFQAEMTDAGRVQVKNFDTHGAAEGLDEILHQKGARELHLITAEGDLHVRVTKKGHVLTSRSQPMARTIETRGNDRVKTLPLTMFDASAFLRVTGLSDGSGQIRASMRGKYDQVNEFLKVAGEVLKDYKPESDNIFTIVDCGCGKAYLTFALWYYLVHALKMPHVKVIGVDRRADVISAARQMAKSLDLTEQVVFEECDLTTYEKPGRVDMIVSLHACDTATDEALARGVEWHTKYILSAPCCQHELQKALASESAAVSRRSFRGLLRQGILRERLCDLLTDSFRAMILRILGYKTQVIEFVSGEATARNILLRAEHGVKPGQAGPVGEYLDLRESWDVTPFLETRLGEMLKPYLERYV